MFDNIVFVSMLVFLTIFMISTTIRLDVLAERISALEEQAQTEPICLDVE